MLKKCIDYLKKVIINKPQNAATQKLNFDDIPDIRGQPYSGTTIRFRENDFIDLSPDLESDMIDRTAFIRLRAYKLWEEAGKPDNLSVKFWLMAEEQYLQEHADNEKANAEYDPKSNKLRCGFKK